MTLSLRNLQHLSLFLLVLLHTPEALPSLRTVQRIVYEEYRIITEGEFRFDELKNHLEAHCAPNVVSIGEDATRVIARVDYDNLTNRLMGFVLPCDTNGLPIADFFLATSFENHFKVPHYQSMLLCTWPKLCAVMSLPFV